MTRTKLGLRLGLLALVVAIATAAGGVASAGATPIVCANFVSSTNTSSTLTVTFDVFQAPCTVTLTSYQSQTGGGHTHQVYSTGTDLSIGLHTLTVPVTCGTDNQLDLFVGPTPPPEPNETTDLHAFAVTPACAPPPPVCTYTKGFYKNHLSVVAAYAPSGVGGFNLLDTVGILTGSPSKLPAGQGGALNLAQQALTALLNENKGATASSAVNSAITTALASLHITLVNHIVTSVTVNSGTDVGGLTNIIEPFNSATDCS